MKEISVFKDDYDDSAEHPDEPLVGEFSIQVEGSYIDFLSLNDLAQLRDKISEFLNKQEQS